MAGLFSGKIALITGASRGLGRATALALAKGGAHVILLAKQTAALRAADDAIRREGGSATLTPLDLTDGAGLDRLGAAIFERWGRLDILVGSASALGALSPVSHIQPALWDEILAVNLTANWRLIRSLEPLLRQSPAGRAVFLTCDEARQKKPYWSAYASSKAALKTLILIWAREMAEAESKLRINLYDPVAAATVTRRAIYPGEDLSLIPKPEEVIKPLLSLLDEKNARHGEIVSFKR